jgi:hypothetical protein
MKMMKEPITFSRDGKRIVDFDKRFLKKNPQYGYHIIHKGLIHYFDKNKRYERSKIYVANPRDQAVKMLNDPRVSFDAFYNFLRDKDLGFWDGVNSREIIEQYLAEMIPKGIHVSHIVRALETSSADLFKIWLGNSMETPQPIRTKKDLFEALEL